MKPESIALATAAKSAEAICKRYESSNLGRGDRISRNERI